MPLILRDYICQNGHKFEHLDESDIKLCKCPICGDFADAVLSATAGWCPSIERTKGQLQKRANKEMLTKHGVERSRHQFDKAMGMIKGKLDPDKQ